MTTLCQCIKNLDLETSSFIKLAPASGVSKKTRKAPIKEDVYSSGDLLNREHNKALTRRQWVIKQATKIHNHETKD